MTTSASSAMLLVWVVKSTFSCIHCRILCAPSDDLRCGPWKFVVKVFLSFHSRRMHFRTEAKLQLELVFSGLGVFSPPSPSPLTFLLHFCFNLLILSCVLLSFCFCFGFCFIFQLSLSLSRVQGAFALKKINYSCICESRLAAIFQ